MVAQIPPMPAGPPYASPNAALGGLPTPKVDIPPSAVFIAIYVGFAVTNMTILQINLRRKHKFIMSGLLFGFCMARITTLVLRIAWSTRQHNVRLAIAANIFLNAGVLILYLINIIFAQRILRAKQPQLGWHRVLRTGFRAVYVLLVGALFMVITTVVLSSYSRNTYTLHACRYALLAALTFIMALTVLPLAIMALAWFLPTSSNEDHFGHGSLFSKTVILTLSTCLCMTISGFKTGINWMPPRPVAHPAWYQSKACFYIFNFTLEITVLALLTLSRVDKRFHVPNGSNQPGDYSRSWSVSSDDEADIAAEQKKAFEG